MPVVSDTSPLSNLAAIGRLALVQEQFGEVLVPAEVARELERFSHPGGQAAIRAAWHDGWLRICPLPDNAPAPGGISHLDAGERAALRLALSLSADRVLMDERKGRMAAENLGLQAIGVVGILITAKEHGRIDSMARELRRLWEEAHFFLAPGFVAHVLAGVGEKP